MAQEDVSLGEASHRHEADVLSSATQASDLSYLASTAALYLRMMLLRQQEVGNLPKLLETTRSLASELHEILSGQATPDRELPYRQLLPVRVWRQATPSIPNLAKLVTQLEGALAGTLADGELEQTANDLERVARVLREQSALSIATISA